MTAEFFNALNNHRHMGSAVDGDGAIDSAPDTGAANAYAIALTPALAAHVPGMPISFLAVHANTAASTLAINGLAPVAIRKYGAAVLQANDIQAGQMVSVVHDGTYYQMQSMPAAAMQAASAVLAADASTSSATYTSTGLGLSITLSVGASGIAIVAAGMNQKPTDSLLTGSLRINQDNASYRLLGRTGELVAQAAVSGVFIFTGLSVGNHTFTLEWKRITGSGSLQCRASSLPDNDAAYITGFSI
jgi:hypothetical protein